MVYEMGGKWPYSCCLWGSTFPDLFTYLSSNISSFESDVNIVE